MSHPFYQYKEILKQACQNHPHKDAWRGFSKSYAVSENHFDSHIAPLEDKNDGACLPQWQPTAYPEEWWDRLPYGAFIYKCTCRYPRALPGYDDVFQIASIAFSVESDPMINESGDYPVKQEHCEQFSESFLRMINDHLGQS